MCDFFILSLFLFRRTRCQGSGCVNLIIPPLLPPSKWEQPSTRKFTVKDMCCNWSFEGWARKWKRGRNWKQTKAWARTHSSEHITLLLRRETVPLFQERAQLIYNGLIKIFIQSVPNLEQMELSPVWFPVRRKSFHFIQKVFLSNLSLNGDFNERWGLHLEYDAVFHNLSHPFPSFSFHKPSCVHLWNHPDLQTSGDVSLYPVCTSLVSNNWALATFNSDTARTGFSK